MYQSALCLAIKDIMPCDLKIKTVSFSMMKEKLPFPIKQYQCLALSCFLTSLFSGFLVFATSFFLFALAGLAFVFFASLSFFFLIAFFFLGARATLAFCWLLRLLVDSRRTDTYGKQSCKNSDYHLIHNTKL